MGYKLWTNQTSYGGFWHFSCYRKFRALPREVRVANLRNVLETLHIADEIARQGYLITSSELADLMDVNASAVTSRGEFWGVEKLDCFSSTTRRQPNFVAN
jgi:hypothetical protein